MITIRPDQLPAFFENAAKKYRAAAIKGLRLGAGRCLGMVKQRTSNLRPRPPVNTGGYKARWQVEKIEAGAILFNDAPYAGIIEEGVRPMRIPLPKVSRRGGPVPMKALRLWVEQKLMRGAEPAIKVSRKGIARRAGKGLDGNKSGLAKFLRRNRAARYMQRRRQGVAWAVAVGIQRRLHFRGIPGRQVLTEPRFVTGMRRVAQSEIRRCIEEASRG